MDRPLTLMERLGLRIHMTICRICRLYRNHLHIVHRLSRRAGVLVMDHPDQHLSSEARERIKQRLSRPD
jgi:hypothetical protein